MSNPRKAVVNLLDRYDLPYTTRINGVGHAVISVQFDSGPQELICSAHRTRETSVTNALGRARSLLRRNGIKVI